VAETSVCTGSGTEATGSAASEEAGASSATF